MDDDSWLADPAELRSLSVECRSAPSMSPSRSPVPPAVPPAVPPGPPGPPPPPPPPPPVELLRSAAQCLLDCGSFREARDTNAGRAYFYAAGPSSGTGGPIVTWDLAAWLEREVTFGPTPGAPSAADALLTADVPNPATERTPDRRPEPQVPEPQAASDLPALGDTDAWRAKLDDLYRRHNPSKRAVVVELLARYKGREEELWRNLCVKYEARSPPSKASAARTPQARTPLAQRASSRSATPKAATPHTPTPKPTPKAATPKTLTPRLTPQSAADLKAARVLARSPSSSSTSRPQLSGRSVTPAPALSATTGRSFSTPAKGTRSTTPTGPAASPKTDLAARRMDDMCARRAAVAAQRDQARQRREEDLRKRQQTLQRVREADALPTRGAALGVAAPAARPQTPTAPRRTPSPRTGAASSPPSGARPKTAAKAPRGDAQAAAIAAAHAPLLTAAEVRALLGSPAKD